MRGGQYQVMLLLKCLRNAGHESELLARTGGPLWSAAESAGFAVHAAEVKELWRLSKYATLVHAHDARAHTISAMASRRKFVVSRRVAFPVKRSVASIWKYQRAARYLAVSQFVAEQLLAAGVRQEKIDVVHDGVETPNHLADWQSGGPAIAVDSTDPAKGRSLIEEAARLAGIPVLFTTNLREDLGRASMFVYISQIEGLGSAALLAMSMGIPVVASAVPGLSEAVTDGVSGLIVPNEVSEIAAAMRRILDQPVLAQTLRSNGRSQIADHFTEDHLLRNTLASYEKALAG